MPNTSPYPQDNVCGTEPIAGMKKQITLQRSPLLQLDFVAPWDHIAGILDKYDREPFELPEGSGKTIVSIGTFNHRKDVPLIGWNVSLARNTYVSIHVRKKGSDDKHAETFYLDFYNSSAAYRFVNKRFNSVDAKASGTVTYDRTSEAVVSQAAAADQSRVITRLKMSLNGVVEEPYTLRFMATTSMGKVGATDPSDLWVGAYSVDSLAYTKPFSEEEDAFEIGPDHFGNKLSPTGDLAACDILPSRWLWIPEINVTYFKAEPT